jgi:hypothetical protein
MMYLSAHLILLNLKAEFASCGAEGWTQGLTLAKQML